MLGAGTVINPILKIVTTVAILAAVYFFMVKPILDTTNNAFDEFGGAFDTLPTDVQDEVDEALNQLEGGDAEALERCIRQAIPNQRAIDRCLERANN